MQDIDARNLLKNLIDECPRCRRRFLENVPLIIDDDQALSDEQVEAVFIDLSERHVKHKP